MILTLVITCYRQSDHIREMLNAIRGEIVDGAVEVIVVDDSMGDDPGVGSLEDFGRVVSGSHKLFAGGCRNLGASIAGGEWLWFIDGDDAVRPGAVTRVLEAIRSERTNSCLVMDYATISPGGTDVVSFANRRRPDEVPIWAVGVMAWFKCIRRMAYVEMRETMAEDGDWWVRQSMRLVRDGVGPLFYSKVPGGPCYDYVRLGDGAFTSALNRFDESRNGEQALGLIMRDSTVANSVAAQLRQIAEFVEIAPALKDMPEAFRDHHRFLIKFWADKYSEIWRRTCR